MDDYETANDERTEATLERLYRMVY